MEKFQLNAKTSPGICDARRCKETSDLTVLNDGTKLCGRHINMMTDADREVHEAFEEEMRQEAEQPNDNPEKKEANVQVSSGIQEYIAPIKEEAEEMVEELADFTIENDDMAEVAADLMNEIHGKIKELEAKRLSVTGPINKSLTELNSWFRPARKALESAKKVFKKELERWATLKEAERIKALESDDPRDALNLAPQGLSSIGTRETWTFEVVDASKVPLEFMMVNEQAIRAAIRATDPATLEIPGIKISKKESVTAGR